MKEQEPVGKKEQAAETPAPEPATRDDVRALSSPTRCAACAVDIALNSKEWVACSRCLARHHPACWKNCAACGESVSLPASQQEERAPKRLRYVAAAGIVALAGLVVAHAATGFSSPPDPVSQQPAPPRGPDIRALVGQLKSAETRSAAVVALGECGIDAIPALTALALELDSPLAEAEKRKEPGPPTVVATARAIGEVLRLGGPKLTSAFSRPLILKRYAETRHVMPGILDAAGPEAVPMLADLLKAEYGGTRQKAVTFLCKLSPNWNEHTAPVLVEALADPGFTREVGNRIARTRSVTAIPGVVDLVYSEDARVRSSAMRTLGGFRRGRDGWYRGVESFVKALEKRGDGDALPALIEFLSTSQDRPATFIWILFSAVDYLGPRANALVPTLIDLLDCKPGMDDRAGGAARSLGRVGPHELSVPALIEVIDSPQNRYWVVTSLGNLGPAAREAIPALKQASLQKENRGGEYRWALSQIDPDGVKDGVPWLGLRVGPAPAESLGEFSSGVKVQGLSNCPASAAGVTGGDILVALNDVPVTDAKHCKETIYELEVGTPVVLTLLRDGVVLNVRVTVAAAR